MVLGKKMRARSREAGRSTQTRDGFGPSRERRGTGRRAPMAGEAKRHGRTRAAENKIGARAGASSVLGRATAGGHGEHSKEERKGEKNAASREKQDPGAQRLARREEQAGELDAQGARASRDRTPSRGRSRSWGAAWESRGAPGKKLRAAGEESRASLSRPTGSSVRGDGSSFMTRAYRAQGDGRHPSQGRARGREERESSVEEETPGAQRKKHSARRGRRRLELAAAGEKDQPAAGYFPELSGAWLCEEEARPAGDKKLRAQEKSKDCGWLKKINGERDSHGKIFFFLDFLFSFFLEILRYFEN
jgi:hypothetical protein